MTPDEMAGRLMVLEAMVVSALSLALGDETVDPGFKRADRLLIFLRHAVAGLANQISSGVAIEAEEYAERVLELVKPNLRNAELNPTP